jgi:sirohydrochlorin ferrochelatase
MALDPSDSAASSAAPGSAATSAADFATVVVLAAHGAPPTDYPRMRVGLLMLLEYSPKALQRLPFVGAWRERLRAEVAGWPRTRVTDPYKAAVDDLAKGISSRLGVGVVPGYNEFCAPTVEGAIAKAIADGAARVLVIPTMLLRGNAHTEAEIHEAVRESSLAHPTAQIEYVWPFAHDRMVTLFAGEVLERLEGHEAAGLG